MSDIIVTVLSRLLFFHVSIVLTPARLFHWVEYTGLIKSPPPAILNFMNEISNYNKIDISCVCCICQAHSFHLFTSGLVQH